MLFRSRTGLGRRSSTSISRGTTPLRMHSSPPPPFHPMQSPESVLEAASSGAPSTIASSLNSAQISMNSNNPWTSPRGASLSPRLGAASYGQNWGILGLSQLGQQRIASPAGFRVRSRQSNTRLRASGSRAGLRANSATPISSHSTSYTGGTNINSPQGRVPPQQAQQQPAPQQQQQQQQQRPGPVTRSSSSSSRVITAADIRARGERLRQEQLRMIHGGGPLRQPSEGTSGGDTSAASNTPPSAPPSSRSAGDIPQDARRGNRLGALIGGGPADQRGGGPMLVVANDNDRAF